MWDAVGPGGRSRDHVLYSHCGVVQNHGPHVGMVPSVVSVGMSRLLAPTHTHTRVQMCISKLESAFVCYLGMGILIYIYIVERKRVCVCFQTFCNHNFNI